ncbi:MAG TPA: NAD(P)-dependent oxidoreductase [Gemmatimonadaceae bacterium]
MRLSSRASLPGRVLISGANGYIGRHVAAAFVERGAEVHALVRHSSRIEPLLDLVPEVRVHRCDESLNDVPEVVRASRPGLVVHLAARITAGLETGELTRLVKSNILLGAHLLQAQHQSVGGGFINTGTFWQHAGGRGYSPVNLYAATKQAFEAILGHYCAAGRIRAMTLVLYDVYGQADPRARLISQLHDALRTGQQLSLSPGKQQLEMVHVSDVAAAYVRAAELMEGSPRFGDCRRFGVTSSAPLTLRDVVATYARIAGRRPPVKWGGRPYREREVMKPRRFRRLPGWTPLLPLEDGLRLVLESDGLLG